METIKPASSPLQTTDEKIVDARVYSPFGPAVLALLAIIGFFLYQIHEVQSHRNISNYEYAHDVAPNLEKAQNTQDRLIAVLRDLIDTSAKDDNAKQIVKECHQAGILRDRPPAANSPAGANAALNPTTNAAPATPAPAAQ